MNKIFRIVWNEAAQAWVAVSELTKKHKKRASATVATAVLATVLSAAVQASVGASGGANEPSPEFDPAKPQTFTDPYETKYDDDNENYKFGLLVTDKKGTLKKPSEADAGAISVEPNEASTGAPKYKSSFLYLRENGGITIDQEGRSAKFSVNAGDGLKVNDGEGEDGKLVADTVKLTVEGGKVTAPTEENKKKLVNAGDLSSVLNDLGWKVSAGGTTSTVKSGDEVEFKGDGVTVTNTTDEHGKHIVTIKAEQPQGGAAGKSAYEIWKEANPDNATKSEGEFLASLKGDKGTDG
ncbi:MAG: ESPR domain-containing protein, partial [Haemophilus haemolyticus]|nr:ESPR domain-containing protein [Haemophilus haemolyticus]